VKLRRVTEAVTEVRHPETGERLEMHTYTLRRDHPIVAKDLAAGHVVLSPAVEIRLLTLAEPGEAAND
jgi:hypothetical protein